MTMTKTRAHRRRDPATTRTRLLICAALLGLAGVPAGGGEAPLDPDLDPQGLRRAGPFLLRPFVALKDAGYDDNIRYEAQEPEGDTTATAGAGLDGLLLFGHRGGLRFSQALDYVAFGENTDLNHWDGRARARALLRAGRTLVSFEDHFSSVRERPNSEVDLRLRRETHTATVGLKSLQKGRLGARASLRARRIDYAAGEESGEDAVRRLTRDESALVVTGELRARPKTTLLLEGALERVRFDDPGEGRDTRARSVLTGVRFDPSAGVQGELKVGVTSLDAPDRPGSDYRGVVGSGNLRVRLGSATRARVGLAREVEFSTLTENLYYVARLWSLGLEQFFTRRLSGEIGYGRGRNHYPEEVTRAGAPGFQGIRDDRLTHWNAGLRYRLVDRLTLVAAAHRQERDSTDDFNDRQRRFYTFGTTLEF